MIEKSGKMLFYSNRFDLSSVNVKYVLLFVKRVYDYTENELELEVKGFFFHALIAFI